MDALEILRLALRYIHLIGFALLFGGFVVQYVTGTLRINSAMLWGSLIQVITGVLLSAPFPAGIQLNYPKIGVKLLLAVTIATMVVIPWARKRDQINRGHFVAIGLLTLLNAAVATFWR